MPLMRQVSDAQLLATAAGACLMWTCSWTRLLQIVPVPATTAYKRRLERGILRAWSRDQRLHNTQITVTNSRSLENLNKRKAAKRAAELTAMVSRLADNAPKAIDKLPDWDEVPLP